MNMVIWILSTWKYPLTSHVFFFTDISFNFVILSIGLSYYLGETNSKDIKLSTLKATAVVT